VDGQQALGVYDKSQVKSSGQLHVQLGDRNNPHLGSLQPDSIMAQTVASEPQPPSYLDPPAFVPEGELPDYHRNAAADERIVLAEPQAPRPSTGARTDYIFRSPRLELNLGEKKWPVKLPCYGWEGTVNGTLLVNDFKAVTRIVVTVSFTHRYRLRC